jgi:hypothetical protein
MLAEAAAGFVALIAVVAALLLASPASGHTGPVSSEAAACKSTGRTLAASGYKPALRTYDDFIDDSGNAPDFCAQEIVTNDGQTITIGIHAHNRSGFEAGDTYTIFLDTDLNAAAGGGGVGAEYAITFSGPTAQLMRWNGTSFDPASATSVPVDWIDGYGPILTFDRTAIGDPPGFNFVLVSANGQDSDRAPDAGSWSYTLTPFALEVKKLSLGQARAGHLFSAHMLVMRSDFDQPLTEGAITCTASVSGQTVLARERFVHNRVVCTWSLPKSARGRPLVGNIAVTFQGVEAHKVFTLTVR